MMKDLTMLLEVELDLYIAVVLGRVLLCLDESVDHLTDTHQNAGVTPAMNSLPTEIPVMELYSTIRMEGGMVEPIGCGCRGNGSGVVAVETGFVHGADQHARRWKQRRQRWNRKRLQTAWMPEC